MSFCLDHGLVPVPCSEQTILLFIAQLYVNGLKASSVRVYMSAIRSLHIQDGHNDYVTNTDRVKLAIRAIEIPQPPPVQKLPITLDLLQKMYLIIDHLDYNSSMIWTAMCTAHFGCLRAGEFTVKNQNYNDTSLFRKDVNITTTVVILKLRTSKTDTSNTGTDITIACTSRNICAHCSMIHYCKTRDQLHSCDKPLFMFSNGLILSRDLFIKQTRLYLSMIGLDPSLYSGHSYRAGSATTAALAGLQDWEIKKLGRWKSDTYQRYIRPCVSYDSTVASKMCNESYK